jgi:hypothetical protein
MTSDPRIRDPLLDTVDAKDLRPPQITVGYREVEAKAGPGATGATMRTSSWAGTWSR